MKNQIRIKKSSHQVIQRIEEQDAGLVWVLVGPAMGTNIQKENSLRANNSKVSS